MEKTTITVASTWILLISTVFSFTPKLIQPRLPPLEVSCMADTPIILRSCLMVWPRTNKPVTSIECKLSGFKTLNCTTTAVLFTGVPTGTYRLVLTARTELEEASATYRLIMPATPNTCTAHLINRGITVTNHTAVAEFSGCGPYNGFMCRLDSPTSFPCQSPLMLQNLTEGVHWLRVTPYGCHEEKRQTFFFDVPSSSPEPSTIIEQ